MAEVHAIKEHDSAENEGRAALTRADLTCPIGPSFFLGQLGGLVRDRCPDPSENVPLVQIRLADGDTLEVCHIIGASPRWVMLAVADPASHHDGMAIELVPYELIWRVSICARRTQAGSIGFSQLRAPEIIAPETLLQAVMDHHAA